MADGLTDEQVSATLDYLGGNQPGVVPRLTTLPSSSASGGAVNAPVTGGTGAAPGDPQRALGSNPDAPGASPFAIAGQVLKTGKSLAELSADIFKAHPEARGSVGGEGTNQDASKSLSDTLRSSQGAQPPGSGVPPEGSALSTPPPESLGTGIQIGGEIGSGVPGPGSALSTPPPESLGTPPLDTSVSGALGTGGLAGTAVSAALELAAMLTGNQDVAKAGQALGAGAGLASTAAAEAAAIAASEAGVDVAGGVLGAAAAPLGVVAAPLIFASIARLAGAGGLDISDFWGGGAEGGEFKGVSKVKGQLRTRLGDEASQNFENAKQSNLTYDQAVKQGVTDPAVLSRLGSQLFDTATSYYTPLEEAAGQQKIPGVGGNEGLGQSSTPQGLTPEGHAPFDQALFRALAVNDYLTAQGKPPLTVPKDLISAAGVGVTPLTPDENGLTTGTYTPDQLAAIGLDPKGTYSSADLWNYQNTGPGRAAFDTANPAYQAYVIQQLKKKFGAQVTPYDPAAAPPAGAPATPAATPTPGAIDFARKFSTEPLAALPGGPEGALGFAQEATAA